MRQTSLRKILGRNGLLETEAYWEIGVNRDDIMRMAMEADLFEGSDDQVVRFAALVAAAERERIASWAEGTSFGGEYLADAIRARGDK